MEGEVRTEEDPNHSRLHCSLDGKKSILFFAHLFHIFLIVFCQYIFCCSHILCRIQVYYLDNLDCPNVERNMDTPRWSQYSKDRIEKICNADRLTFKDGSLSYGKLHVSKFFYSVLIILFFMMLVFVICSPVILFSSIGYSVSIS